MHRTLLYSTLAALILAFMSACAPYNQEPPPPPSTPTPTPGPAQTVVSQGTPPPSTCPSDTPAVPASIPGVPNLPADAKLTTTPSGLQYADVAPGSGPMATPGRQVIVQYTGWLTDGKKFDSSRDRGQPFTFPLGTGQVIKGWDEGVTGMHPGGQRRLIIPPNLGYGVRGSGAAIPPCSTLVFDVELVELK